MGDSIDGSVRKDDTENAVTAFLCGALNIYLQQKIKIKYFVLTKICVYGIKNIRRDAYVGKIYFLFAILD